MIISAESEKKKKTIVFVYPLKFLRVI